MPPGTAPSVERRRLRSILRRERDALGLTQDQVATAMEWSLSKVIRIESGSVSITTNDLKALLDLYGVKEKAPLLELARAARKAPWWNDYRDDLAAPFVYFLGLEGNAARMQHFHPSLVPGILQTAGYAREVFERYEPDPISSETLDRRVELRMRRLNEFLNQHPAPAMEVILDEAVVRRMVGGAEVMKCQLDHLYELSTRPEVSIQVLPFSKGAHPGGSGTFIIMDFADEDAAPVIYLEGAFHDQVVREKPEVLEVYRKVFARLQAMALSPDESAEFIRRVASDLVNVTNQPVP